jgi:hypothetical protein
MKYVPSAGRDVNALENAGSNVPLGKRDVLTATLSAASRSSLAGLLEITTPLEFLAV